MTLTHYFSDPFPPVNAQLLEFTPPEVVLSLGESVGVTCQAPGDFAVLLQLLSNGFHRVSGPNDATRTFTVVEENLGFFHCGSTRSDLVRENLFVSEDTISYPLVACESHLQSVTVCICVL